MHCSTAAPLCHPLRPQTLQVALSWIRARLLIYTQSEARTGFPRHFVGEPLCEERSLNTSQSCSDRQVLLFHLHFDVLSFSVTLSSPGKIVCVGVCFKTLHRICIENLVLLAQSTNGHKHKNPYKQKETIPSCGVSKQQCRLRVFLHRV